MNPDKNLIILIFKRIIFLAYFILILKKLQKIIANLIYFLSDLNQKFNLPTKNIDSFFSIKTIYH